MKLYKMQNAVHDIDRERPHSIANNIVMNMNVVRNIPYFNKREKNFDYVKFS